MPDRDSVAQEGHCAKCAAPGLASLRSRGRPCAVNHSSEPSSRAAAPDDTEPLDPVTSRVALSALRLLAGTVPKKRLQALRQTVDKAGGEYPWERVTDALNAEPAEQQQLVQQGLRAQRDWILREGRETPKASMKSRGKGFMARLLGRLIFFALILLVAVILLILLKARWPDLDIYGPLPWLRETFPRLFGPG